MLLSESEVSMFGSIKGLMLSFYLFILFYFKDVLTGERFFFCFFFFSVHVSCVYSARDILRPWFVLGTRELTIVKKKGKICGNPVKVTK